ncbi:hypothetical protein ERX37_04740 [Macrococcus hajekii]|uniref:histidine kinase n=1 Tax=Macrococcus hajekii TaxID=198482 RepID=A0A4V3BEE3_9STAP|nr:ATP-binding protein [Macrococcus hajekii]TDM03395.1 hypothetical protein ERX37_04740 [Macrococcus hajekii]GGA98494.1 sporulation kinase D [Macrococcus hajekii]
MNQLKKYILVNLAITLTLSILSFSIIYNYDKSSEEMNMMRSMSLHQQQIEALIDDAMGTVETLATVIDVAPDDQAILSSMKRIKERDVRYKNIYIVNDEGQVILSSNNRIMGSAEHPYAFYRQHADTHQIAINFNTEELSGIDDIYVSKLMTYKDQPVAVVTEMDINTTMAAIDAIQEARTVELADLNNNIIFKSSLNIEERIRKTALLQNVDWKLTIISPRHLVVESFEKSFILFLLLTLIVALIQLFRNVYERQKEKLHLIEEINAQKKELIGMLAANTAHEIKNPLTSVRGFVELLELKYDREGKNPHFSIVMKEIDRITDIVGQFLLLGKPTELNNEPTDVVAVVKHTLNFMKYDFDVHQMRLVSSYRHPELYTMMSADQLKQVLINILQNAKEAIPEERNGIIDIKVQLQDDIIITIRDNGVGISEHELKRLFEPFYTTKIAGTGLGLPVTRNMIELAGGKLDVLSTVNVGTTFIIRLPLIQS